jgi:peptidoglycan/LPS O-acetylase OafA/YrhL
MGARRRHAVAATRVPAFDGLRGLAVAAVLLFHAEVSGARGGFLGVSAFFTLSGFLITSVLLSESRRTGRIGLRAFWAGRARRLLPAATVALAGVLVFGALAADAHQVRDLRGDVLGALGYVANWHFIIAGRSYSALFSEPSPVLHFWSLAIEEQFYVVFPLLLFGAFRLFRGRLAPIATVLGVATIGSVTLTFAFAQNTDRAYYGTDTRAAELLIGALLALLVVRWPGPRTVAGRRVLGGAGLGALGLLLFWWSTVERDDSWLYHGGLALHAVVTAVVIAAACAPTTVERLLAIGPVAALGRISYGVYLYHWPIFLWLSPQRVTLPFAALLALRLAVTLACAIVSFHLLEEPIRTRRVVLGAWPRVLTPAAASLLVVGLLAVTASPPSPAFTLTPLGNAQTGGRSAATLPAAVAQSIGIATAAAPVASAPATSGLPAPPAYHRAETPGRPVRVLVVGDSVGITLGRGIQLWARDNGQITVVNDARKWCSLGRDLPRIAGMGPSLQGAGCNDWATRWSREIDSFDPDVVVVLYTLWELIPRQLPGASDFTQPGDPAHDHWQRSEYEAAADVLGAHSANVVWLTIPCSPDTGSGRGTPTWDVNTSVIGAVPRSRPFVRVLDLDAQLCPAHAFHSAYRGIDPARPDGHHFSDDGALAVAQWMMPILLGDVPPPQPITTGSAIRR